MKLMTAPILGPPASSAALAARLDAVRERIDQAGGDADAVTIVGVTKHQPIEVVQLAQAAGLCDLGHNYQQGLIAQHDALARDDRAGDATGERWPRWHFVGHLQRNKVRKLAGIVAVWETVDRVALAAEIAKQAPGASVLVQVNTTAELQKGGCALGEVDAVVDGARAAGLNVQGLMTIGLAGEADGARRAFRSLRSSADRLGLPECSMGMSNDLELAVQEGSTAVRIGTALFGPRMQPSHVRD